MSPFRHHRSPSGPGHSMPDPGEFHTPCQVRHIRYAAHNVTVSPRGGPTIIFYLLCVTLPTLYLGTCIAARPRVAARMYARSTFKSEEVINEIGLFSVPISLAWPFYLFLTSGRGSKVIEWYNKYEEGDK